MATHLPHFNVVSSAIDRAIVPQGLQKISDIHYSWNYRTTKEAHDMPPGFRVLTLREFVSARIFAFESMLEKAQVSLVQTKTKALFDIVMHNKGKLLPLIPDIWQDRFHTATVMYRACNGDIQYIDMPDRFRNFGVDFTLISDGGVKVMKPIQETPYSVLTWHEYLKDRGGQHSIKSLENHTLVRARIPDMDLRKHYLSCLGIFGILMKQLRPALWAPREIVEDHLREEHVGIGEATFYPANAGTQNGRVVAMTAKS